MNRQANIPRWVALCRRLRAVFSGRLAVAQNAKALIPCGGSCLTTAFLVNLLTQRVRVSITFVSKYY